MRLGRYELLYRLARGGMGEVFVARRKGPGDIEKRVVIKRIRRDLSGDPRFVDMFLREARVSMTLSHKNIAAVFDFGRAGQELFLAMEHVHGRDLARALSAAKKKALPLSPTAAAYLGIEVCRALEYAHGASSGGEPIVHRDLSPKNLLLSFSGEIVVADFGLAIASSDALKESGVRGTPAYLSPEQARGEKLDGRSDLFSLGLVLREIISGERVYPGSDPKEIIELAKQAAMPALSDSIPEALSELLTKATAREPQDRYDSARAMQRALDSFLVKSRAAGAEAPGLEISGWLRSMFDESDDALDRVSSDFSADNVLKTVTLAGADLDDDHVGNSTMVSVAETIGDSSLDSKVEKDDEPEATGDADPPVGGRRWIALLLALAAIGGIATVVALSENRKENAETANLGPKLPNAQPPDEILDASPRDAAAPDAARAVADAAIADAPIKAVAKQFGWVRVQSRPWAAVKIRGSAGCPETPCRIKLKAGRHTIVLVSPVTGAKATRRVTVRSNGTVDVSATLKAPAR